MRIINMKTRELLQLLFKVGWYSINQEGSHLQLKHPMKKGKITVPMHNGDIAKGTLNRILKDAGLKGR